MVTSTVTDSLEWDVLRNRNRDPGVLSGMNTDSDATPAPLPWLDNVAGIAAPATQTWTNHTLAPVRLIVCYRYTAADFRRVILTQSLRQLRILSIVMLVLYGFFLVFVLGITLYMQRTSGRNLPPLLPFFGSMFITLMVIPVATVGCLTSIVILFAPLVARFDKPMEYEISRDGVRFKRAFGRLVSWSLFSAIRLEKHGDVHMVLRYGMGAALVVPRSVFGDSVTAEQFHEALTALWKAKGMLVGVAESVRATFAPSSP